MTYQEYLDSPTWKALKTEALRIAKNRCQACDSTDRLNVHHRKYPRVYGSESASDLVVLCRKCHKAFHSRRTVTQKVATITGKITQTRKRYHYWVKGIENGTIRALCNPGIVRMTPDVFSKNENDELCKVCALQLGL